MPQSAGDASASRMGGLQIIAAALLGAAVAFMVWRVAWVTEDCFITFRYVANTLAGHGAVFNTGEFTQGYTHPLWFLLLLLGGSVVPDLIVLSCGLGLLLTIATQFLVTRGLMRAGGHSLRGGLAAALFALICVSSNSWLSFQTGGLENALSHLLLVILIGEIFRHELERPLAISALGSLLVLSRPDFAFSIMPIAVAMLPRLRDPRSRRAIALGALPLAIWVAFASVAACTSPKGVSTTIGGGGARQAPPRSSGVRAVRRSRRSRMRVMGWVP